MDINAAREAIDQLDEKLVKLLSRRMKLSLLIAKLKAQVRLPARDARREAAILARARQLAEDPLPGMAAADVLKRVLEVSRAVTSAAFKRGKHEKRA